MKTSYYKKALKLLEGLHKSYPTYTLGQHIYTALADYGDFWGITDKELCFAIEKYEAELQLDQSNLAPEAYVEKILHDGEHLFDNQEEEEEEDY